MSLSIPLNQKTKESFHRPTKKKEEKTWRNKIDDGSDVEEEIYFFFGGPRKRRLLCKSWRCWPERVFTLKRERQTDPNFLIPHTPTVHYWFVSFEDLVTFQYRKLSIITSRKRYLISRLVVILLSMRRLLLCCLQENRVHTTEPRYSRMAEQHHFVTRQVTAV